MSDCKHHQLVLLSAPQKRVRCRHCHLTIDPEELDNGHCPECYEAHNERRYDFETVDNGQAGVVRYRCEACGIIIDA